MLILQEDDGKKGVFKAMDGEIKAGHMTYVWAGDSKFIIDHTEVDVAFEGKGIGKQLVMQAVAYARSRQVKILPLCPFAKSVFNKTAAISDVLF